MALPISGSRFDSLGKKLAAGLVLTAAESEELEAVFLVYDQARSVVQEKVATTGYVATSRLKTTSTLVDKLQRSLLSIRGIDDLAGVRVVIDAGRFKQDRLMTEIRDLFQNETKPPKIHDRRSDHSFGYRAVHVVAYVDRIPVEIQIRTALQHLWAEITEKLGDAWGRGLRYGQGPDRPDETVLGTITRAEFFGVVQELGHQIDEFEQIAHKHSELDHGLSSEGRTRGPGQVKITRAIRTELSRMYSELVSLEDGLRSRLTQLRDACEDLEGR